MKKRSNCCKWIFALLWSVTMVACSDDDVVRIDDNGSKIELPTPRAFILNEGAWGLNNAGMAFFDPNKNVGFISDIYYLQNEAKMGDLANAMIEYDEHIYVVVSGSKYVACLNSAGVEQARYEIPDGEGEPRCIDAEDGYLYVTQYGGRVTKLDARTMTAVGTFQGGDNLEGIAEEGGRLYVANAYKVNDSAYDYNNEILVINAATMQLETSLQVVDNPESVCEINGIIYVLSKGDYALIGPMLQSINPHNGQVTELVAAAKITEGANGELYCVASVYDEMWNMSNTFFKFTPGSTSSSYETSFLQNPPAVLAKAAIYLLEVDEENGDIYVGTSDYVSNGTIYRFDRQGVLKDTFDSGGVNPKTLIFID